MSLGTTALLALSTLLPALSAQEAPSLAPRIAEVLHRASNGHSPAPEEIAPMATISQPAAPDLEACVPLLLKALENTDASVRTYALTTLTGLQTTDAPPEAPTSLPGTPPASAYKPEVSLLLAPAIPRLAAHLTEESPTNRALTASVLGGFSAAPPPSIFPPLYAFLKRDDAIGPIGLAVVSDLLQLGPISADTATAVAHFIRRSDQTPDSRANLADLIATKPNQSQSLNKSLLAYLDSDDPSLRARLILSLPQLDLAPDVFADTRARISQLAENTGENLQVINASKSVASCWTATRMLTGCPAY